MTKSQERGVSRNGAHTTQSKRQLECGRLTDNGCNNGEGRGQLTLISVLPKRLNKSRPVQNALVAREMISVLTCLLLEAESLAEAAVPGNAVVVAIG